jgi:hypothetical protein
MSGFNRNNASNFMHYFGLVMIVAYFTLGIYVLYTDNLNYLQKNIRIIFGFFLFAFGFFRAVTWWQKHKARKYYEESEE